MTALRMETAGVGRSLRQFGVPGKKQRTFEVNVHPTNPYYHAEETEILMGPWADDLGFPIRLISYHEL